MYTFVFINAFFHIISNRTCDTALIVALLGPGSEAIGTILSTTPETEIGKLIGGAKIQIFRQNITLAFVFHEYFLYTMGTTT